ncbi:hypothetical protein SRB5_50650 [Streptomyces sp. RB5]|uniref:Uncharacterized protein n=1 Tax=Streptomyces smaragdinus TaxID=2585196 RepID=A0A7K0CN69_9ACTN|nr:hypothetical protein [Streptomyces smaragdinus]MQY14889.1 hypothetical protein [Streptomyces smaragdinus]
MDTRQNCPDGPGRGQGRKGGRTDRSARRRLRREAPSIVAVLTDEDDFAAMRARPGFGFDDHGTYLDQMAALLRALASQGVHVTVARFDPEEYEAYCDRRGLDPGAGESRTVYTAQLAPLRATVTYEGQTMPRLLHDLRHEDARMRIWERATRELAVLGSCEDCGEDLARAGFDRAVAAFTRLVDGLAPGGHHLVCSVRDGALTAVLEAEPDPAGGHVFEETDALDFCTVLAVAFARNGAGGVVMRSLPAAAGGREQVRGWRLAHGWLQPLSEGEVFSAYCEDAATGEPIPPEPDVDYRAGYAVPPPPPGCRPRGSEPDTRPGADPDAEPGG